jgi:hypothetical protein
MPHGSALLTAPLHKALAVDLRYAGTAYLHSDRRDPRRWQALDRALARHGGGRSGQRCWTAAGDAATLSNSGAPSSGASAWTLAPRDGSGHGARGRRRRSRGADGLDGRLRKRSDGTARRRPAWGMDGVRWRTARWRTTVRRAYPAEGWSAGGRRRASDTGGQEREEWRRLWTGTVDPDTGGRHLYGDGALTRGPRRGKEETDRWDPVAEIFLN